MLSISSMFSPFYTFFTIFGSVCPSSTLVTFNLPDSNRLLQTCLLLQSKTVDMEGEPDRLPCYSQAKTYLSDPLVLE